MRRCEPFSDSDNLKTKRDRLYHRLRHFGLHLTSGRTICPEEQGHIQLLRVPIQRGFRVTNLATGEIVLGKNFDAPISDVERFWEKKYIERERNRHVQKAEKEKEKLRRRNIKWRF